MSSQRYVAVDSDHVVYVFDCRERLEVSLEYQDVAHNEYTVYDEHGSVYVFDVEGETDSSASPGRNLDLTAPPGFRLTQVAIDRRPDGLREALVRHITKRRSATELHSRSLDELVDLAAGGTLDGRQA